MNSFKILILVNNEMNITSKKLKVVVIGLDGGTWNIIKPLIEQGKLPTIEKLMKNSCYGDLESSIPHTTFPAWKCYSTGKNPGRLGVFNFLNVDITNRKFTINNSNSFKSKEIWDYLTENDISSGVYAMPTTYPPKKIKGFMISGFNPKNSNYTYPKHLENELRDKFNYDASYYEYHSANKDKIIKKIESLIKQDFDSINYLIEKHDPDFLHFTIFHTDPLQHFYWKYWKNQDKNYGNIIISFLELIFKKLELLLNKYTDKNTYRILMSDHGFTKMKAIFNINQWLINNNYLKLSKRLFSKNSIYKIAIKLGLNTDYVHKLQQLPIINKIIPRAANIGINVLEETIDWNKSKVIPNLQGPLYINEKPFKNKNEYKIFREKLIKEIKEIKSPKTDEPLVKRVYKKEDLYKGDLEKAPDLILLPNEGYEIYLSFDKNIWDFEPKEEGWSGIHKLTGIFCISGPGIKKNHEIKDAKIIDLAPTILHIFNIPIPDDMDGRVLTECFEEDSELAKGEIVYQDVKKIERLKDKIKELKLKGKI